ncbi:head maturation protease, ClpP-related [Streptomyces sp. NPDC051016]|uniref:head maturation protease, ClpP-related n=1 Tax=Streptomyces sp. NPDC051016 TaxID=3365638 RepID=UPI0037B3694E
MNIVMPGHAAAFAASQREKADKLRAQHGIEPQPWYRITNAADPDEAELLLYDEVGGWWGCTADQMIADLRGVTAPNLRVRINSPGGSVFEGVAIANALRSHPANVTIQVDGIAASIASVIAMAGDRIEMAPNTMMMIHDASGLCMGNAADMAEMEELLDLISDNIADAYAARAGGTRDQWRERMRAETWYLPDDAVENGLADEAISMPKAADPAEPDEGDGDEPDMARPFDLAAYGYTGPQAAPEQVTLTFNVGDNLDEKLLAMLRKVVAKRDEAAPVEDTAVAVHHTATADGSWDGGAQEKKLPAPMPLAMAKAMYAWYDPQQVDDGKLPKTACKFPHHDVDADGKPGAANLAACRNGLARLDSADIPESDRDGVRRHLQAHLDDAKSADDAAAAEPTAGAETGLGQPADDAWAGIVAHLTDDADDWSALVSHLTRPASSGAATEA